MLNNTNNEIFKCMIVENKMQNKNNIQKNNDEGFKLMIGKYDNEYVVHLGFDNKNHIIENIFVHVIDSDGYEDIFGYGFRIVDLFNNETLLKKLIFKINSYSLPINDMF